MGNTTGNQNNGGGFHDGAKKKSNKGGHFRVSMGVPVGGAQQGGPSESGWAESHHADVDCRLVERHEYTEAFRPLNILKEALLPLIWFDSAGPAMPRSD